MEKPRKKGIDIDDKSKWGHRFEFRDRSQVQRQMFTPLAQPTKKRVATADEIVESASEEMSDSHLNSYDFKLEPQTSIPVQLPRAKTQANKKHKQPSEPRKKKKEDSDLIVRDLVNELLNTIELGAPTDTKMMESTFINCDLRYFNLDYIVEKFGLFDVVVVDPPWRIRGGQKNSDSPFMFSNNKFQLEYDTLSNQEIMEIPIEKLSKKGFCFIWVLSGNMNAGYDCLNKWGYECVDHLIWVKTTQGGRRAMVSHGFYFLHSTEMCIVGYKCPPGEKVEFRSKVSNDLIIADVRKKSQKPDQLYTIIELMMPGSKKCEIFARNNNLRPGWLSLGNQIGEVFEKWRNHTVCDKCKRDIPEGLLRFKAKKQRNFDICEQCIENVQQERNDTMQDYFKLENNNTQDTLHHYHKCDRCGVEPIWGCRFQCLQCENIDYCENCYDEITETQTGCFNHAFQAHEKPQAGNGLPIHENKRCVSCYQKPILGPCFLCADCSHLTLCQNCFFNCSFKEFEQIKGHDSKHRIEIITLSNRTFKMSICSGCGRNPLVSPKYKCNMCFNFELCEHCYIKKDTLELKGFNAHKPEHTFTNY